MKQQQEGKKRKAKTNKHKSYEEQIGETSPSGGPNDFTQEILYRNKAPKKYQNIISNYLNTLR